MKLLLEHRSIRKYSPKEISKEDLNEILESGVRASNTGNMQLYSIVVTKEVENKEKLAPFHFNQPMIKNAPVVLTICLDINRFNKWCEINNADAAYDSLLWFTNGVIDSMLLAQNISVAAENKGMGICYLGTTLYNADKIIEALKLPKGVFPVTTITIGYPDESPELVDRIPMEGIVHEEAYQDYDADTIKSLYEYKENLESSKGFVKENSKENLAQVFTDIRYKRADNEFFSSKMINALKAQGFELK